MIKRLLLGMLLASAPSLMAQSSHGHGGGSTPSSVCGDASHALGWTGTVFNCQGITGTAAAGGSNLQLQWNNATALGGISSWTTNGTTTVTGGASSIFDLHLAAISGLLLPGALSSGIVRVTTTTGAITSAELSGDCATSGSNAVICTKTNGSAFVASATTDTTNAANISSGTLNASRLPNPSASTLGGIESLAVVSHKWINTISTSGVPAATQPTLADIAAGQAPTGTFDFSATTHTLPAVVGLAAAKPGTCTAGELYFATDATAGQNLYECGATNTWTQQLNTGGSAGAWSAITNPSGNLALSMAGNTSIFSTTTALSELFGWENTTAAVVGTSQGSPIPLVCGTGFHSSASVKVCAGWGLLPGNGNDAAITVNHLVTTTSTGAITDQFSGGVASGSDGVHAAIVSLLGNTTAPALPSNTFSLLGSNSASFTAFAWQPPTAENGSAGIAHLGAASSHISALTVSQIVAADITNATITGTQIASSVALAGSPTTTTQTAKDNSTKIATTAYVDATTGLTAGTSVTLAAPRQYFVCTGACTITVPVPAAGDEFCVMNDDNIATVITLSAIGSSARYENTARTAYGTAGTGTFVSSGAAGDKVCLLGRDATHYLTASFNGTWTAN